MKNKNAKSCLIDYESLRSLKVVVSMKVANSVWGSNRVTRHGSGAALEQIGFDGNR